ncbi:MAG TPA: TraR/DksA C4-type zinc finger protein, partial [Acidimicrobiales bacterium]|nr:TraR/DksA C4-type zinc finger protein [Acidimicrobiales bacterium]
ARATLRDLDRELARVDDPAYGACAVCRGPIGIDRLEAVPGTRTCVRCPADSVPRPPGTV